MICFVFRKGDSKMGKLYKGRRRAKEIMLEKDKSEMELIVKKRVNGFGICKGAKSFEEEEERHGEFW